MNPLRRDPLLVVQNVAFALAIALALAMISLFLYGGR